MIIFNHLSYILIMKFFHCDCWMKLKFCIMRIYERVKTFLSPFIEQKPTETVTYK